MAHFIRGFFSGIGFYSKANRVIFQYRLWPYLVLPGLLSIGYILLLISLGALYAEPISAEIYARFIPAILKIEAMKIITNILIWIVLLIIGYMSYKHIVLIFFSPILGYLSEKTEERMFHEAAPDFSLTQTAKDIFRSVRINTRNVFWTVGLTIPAWSSVFIPIAGPFLSASLLFLIQAYYSGFGLLDIVMERKKLSAKESLRFVKSHRGLAAGVGAGFTILLLLPIIGWFLAPSYGVIAGTIAALETLEGDETLGVIKQ